MSHFGRRPEVTLELLFCVFEISGVWGSVGEIAGHNIAGLINSRRSPPKMTLTGLNLKSGKALTALFNQVSDPLFNRERGNSNRALVKAILEAPKRFLKQCF